MTTASAATPLTGGSLLQTIEADLSAGESWLEQEALQAGLFLWNTIKGFFVALGPAMGKLVIDVINKAVADAEAGASLAVIETDILNTAAGDVLAAMKQIGSPVIQQIILGIQNNMPTTAS